MNQNQKLKLFKILSGIIALFVMMIYFVPMITLQATAAAWLVDVKTFFVDIKTTLTGNFFYIVFLLAIAATSIFYMWYKPRKIGRGKVAKDISTARKVVLVVLLAAIVIALIVPFITIQATASPLLLDLQGYLIDFKTTVTADFNILVLSGGVIWFIYKIMFHQPKKGR